MLIKTHIVFSAGLLLFIGTLLTHEPGLVFVYAMTVSAVSNVLIDKLGHETININGKSVPRRTPLTHTWPRSVLWGLLVSVFLSPLLFSVVSNTYYNGSELLEAVFVVLLYGITVGPSHMVLDVFTEKGIYVKKDGKWTRFALAHYRYNDPSINGLAVVAGFVLGLVSLMA